METIRGKGGALPHPCEVSWDGSPTEASPATLDLTSSDRISLGERPLQACLLSSCGFVIFSFKLSQPGALRGSFPLHPVPFI